MKQIPRDATIVHGIFFTKIVFKSFAEYNVYSYEPYVKSKWLSNVFLSRLLLTFFLL